MSKVIGGYIPGTKSMRYHPIKNIFTKDNWNTAIIKVINEYYPENNKNILIQMDKNEKESLFQIKMDNDYKLKLYYNDKEIYSDDHLYYYEITFDLKIDIELRDGMIYDC